jgi:hypothetical protein
MFNSNTGDVNYQNNYYTTPILASYVQQPSEPAVNNINDLYVYIKSEFARIDSRLNKIESNQSKEIDEIKLAKEEIKRTVRNWS